MKLKILLASLLSAAASAKGVYVEGDATDSSGGQVRWQRGPGPGSEPPPHGLDGKGGGRLDHTV